MRSDRLYGLACALIGAICVAIVGCGPEPTDGSFRINISDDKEFELRGPASTHTSFESGDSYRLALELHGASSKFGEQNELAVVFDQKPDTGVWRLFTFGKRRPQSGQLAELSFDMGCAVRDWQSDSTLSSYWAFDSGTVNVTAPRSQDGVAGSLRVFLHRQACDPADSAGRSDTGNSVLLSGTFETKRR